MQSFDFLRQILDIKLIMRKKSSVSAQTLKTDSFKSDEVHCFKE